MNQLEYICLKHKNCFTTVKTDVVNAFKKMQKERHLKSLLPCISHCLFMLFICLFLPIVFLIDLFIDQEFTEEYLGFQIKHKGLTTEQIPVFIEEQQLRFQKRRLNTTYSVQKESKIVATFDYLLSKHTFQHHTLPAIEENFSEKPANAIIKESPDIIDSYSFDCTLTQPQLEELVFVINKIHMFTEEISVEKLNDLFFGSPDTPIQCNNNRWMIYLMAKLSEKNLIGPTWQNVIARKKLFLSKAGKLLNQHDLSGGKNNLTSYHCPRTAAYKSINEVIGNIVSKAV